MRYCLFILSFLFLTTPVVSQDKIMLVLDQQKKQSAGNELDGYRDFQRDIDNWGKNRLGNENSVKFAKYLFKQIHRNYLKTYKPINPLDETLTNGAYDCLTGTILITTAYDHFGIDYLIKGNSKHVYIELQGDEVLIEVTNPMGFITDKEVISENKLWYGQLTQQDTLFVYSFHFDYISNEILKGLYSYNMATLAYNNGDFIEAMDQLILTFETLEHPRVLEFMHYTVQQLNECAHISLLEKSTYTYIFEKTLKQFGVRVSVSTQ